MERTGQEEVKTGTTTIGLEFDGGVVLATERRASVGYRVTGKNAKKVYEITDNIGLTTAGSVGDVQSIVRYLRAETRIFKYQKGREMTPKATATLLANMLQRSKALPYMGVFLLGGYDPDSGGMVFSVDPVGGRLSEDKYYATGSGSSVAYGLLEDSFKDSLSEEGAINLALRTIKSASERDVASGDGFSVMVIDEDGVNILDEGEIEERLSEIAE